MKIRLWRVVIMGSLVGLLVGVSLQIAREVQHERENELIASNFAPWSPPLMMDLLKPEVIPIASSLLFASMSAIVWVVLARRKR